MNAAHHIDPPCPPLQPPLLDLWVPGVPVGKGAVRMRIVTPRGGRPFVQAFTDADTKGWMDAITVLARAAWRGRPPVDDAVVVLIDVIVPRTKTVPVAMPRSVWATGLRVRHAALGDVDNFCKGVLDGITKAAVWSDDGRVAEVTVRKYYAASVEPDPTGARVRIARPSSMFYSVNGTP